MTTLVAAVAMLLAAPALAQERWYLMARHGKAVEVRVPERELAMVFARRELCQSIEKR